MNKLYADILTAIAVGDAMGMPTEFMTQLEISKVYPGMQGIPNPEQSAIHSDLPYASVTDDTEQNLFLIKAYLNEGKITVENTAKALLEWVVECDAVNRKYIGPSSLKALKEIERGENPYTTGVTGTTCGGMMRTPAAVLSTPLSNKKALLGNIRCCCIPTHNTSQAIEAAVGYGYALHTAMFTSDLDEVMGSAIAYAQKAIDSMDYVACAPSGAKRLEKIYRERKAIDNEEELLRELYYIYGTGLESIDILTAVFGIFLFAKEDVFTAIKMAARIGGDTDTIAALVGALCTAYAKGHNIPGDITQVVLSKNHLDMTAVANDLYEQFGARKKK